MAFPSGKLTKLTIIFSWNLENPFLGVPFYPMYNPESYKMDYVIDYDSEQKLIVGNLSQKFLRVKPKKLNLKLYFDGTSASPNELILSSLLDAPKFVGVEPQIKAFLALATSPGGAVPVKEVSEELKKLLQDGNSEAHKPMSMTVLWGTFYMTGVLESASVNYTMFSNDGVPIRAEMDVTIVETVAESLVQRIMKLMSPDLSKSIMVKEGDTLPDLCYKEYGDPSFYTKIAEVNNLKNFRKLIPGTELLFPPLK